MGYHRCDDREIRRGSRHRLLTRAARKPYLAIGSSCRAATVRERFYAVQTTGATTAKFGAVRGTACSHAQLGNPTSRLAVVAEPRP